MVRAWLDGSPLLPYFDDSKIEHKHDHAEPGVLSQVITMTARYAAHADSPWLLSKIHLTF
jgi:kynurenine formamidase